MSGYPRYPREFTNAWTVTCPWDEETWRIWDGTPEVADAQDD